MTELQSRLQDVVKRTVANNRWRQSRCFNLIPSETTPSLLVKLCEISDAAGRYAEHRSFKGNEVYYYQGTDFIQEIEEEARREITRFFDCSEAELRPISGQMANEVVFKAMLKRKNAEADDHRLHRLRRVLNNDLTKGGHLSAQPMGALFNYVSTDPESGEECVTHLPLRADNPYAVDVEALAGVIDQAKPDFVILGKSMFLYPEPIEEVRRLVETLSPRPVIHYDMAHVLGLYGAFQAPLQQGADLVTGSTHKTFFGPQRGVVVSDMVKGSELRKLWLDIKSRAFPGSTSNHHLGTLVGLLVASLEMNAFKKEYQTAVLANARSFARALDKAGVRVEGRREDGFTHTHQVVLRVSDQGSGEEIARRLERNNILVNYQALPDDTSFAHTSGIRMGVQEMTRFGLGAEDFEILASLIAEVVLRDADVAEEVTAERAKYLEMSYCLPESQALSLAAQLFGSLFPAEDAAQHFAEALAQTSID
jgi:glycine/serine hydroxymethyltransferase